MVGYLRRSMQARPNPGAHHRAPGIRRPGSMFHPIETGPFKLVVLRPTDSIKAHPQSRYSKPGGAYPTVSNTQIFAGTSAAFDPSRPLGLRTGNGSSCPKTAIHRADPENRFVFRFSDSLFLATARDQPCSGNRAVVLGLNILRRSRSEHHGKCTAAHSAGRIT